MSVLCVLYVYIVHMCCIVLALCITLWPLWSYSRTFHKLGILMAEEGNCTQYHKAICTDLQNRAAFVPYLGFFLTQVVHQTCHQKMQQFHMKRKGAMINKILLSPTTASNQPYGTLRSSSCPNGYGDDVDDSMGRDAHANQSKEDITCASRTLSSSENTTNNACPSIALFPSFSSRERLVVSKQSAFLPMYHRCVQSTHNMYSDSLSADCLHAPSEYPTSCLKTYHSEELLDSLCHNEASAIDDATPDMCASFSSLGSMSGLDDQPRNCLSDSVLHTASDSAADVDGKENDFLSLSYPGVTSPNFSSSAGSLSSESGRRCLRLSTSGGDLHPLGIYSTYSSSTDESHVADISRCALSSAKSSNDIIDTGNAEIPSLPHQRSKSATVGGVFIKIRCPTCSCPDTKRSHSTKCSACAKLANVLEHHHRGAVQIDFGDLKDVHNPKALLQMYQTSSLGCGQGMQRNEEIGRLIRNYHCNTERENYELSYEREPQLTLEQRSSLSPGGCIRATTPI